MKNGTYFGKEFATDPEVYEKRRQEKRTRKYQVAEVCTPVNFIERMIFYAGLEMNFPEDPFVIDENNQFIIEQLYHYVANNAKEFKGNIQKGILLIGPYGTGKTLLARALSKCLEEFWEKCRTTWLPARDIMALEDVFYVDRDVLAEELTYKTQAVLFMDDVGKEPGIINDFGNKSKPWEELISYRYDNNLLIFGTSNLRVDDMNYSQHCKSRMQAMFNVFIMKGKDRRK